MTLGVDLLVIVALARAAGALARKAGQPPVLGEILAGVLLGPTLFHGALAGTLFPHDVRPALALLANVGVSVFMFFVGLHADRARMAGKGRIAASVAGSALAVPFGLGVLLALYLAAAHPARHELGFVLFLGTAMSVTAFPVLARILADRNLVDTPIGGVALACAAVDDVLAWTMLAVVTAVAGGASPWRVLLVVPFAAAMVWAVRPLLARWAERERPASRIRSAAVFLCLGTGLALCATATNAMGLHAFFGAFLFGAVMPRRGAPELRATVLPFVERLSSKLLLPVFFTVAGLGVDLSQVDGRALGELGLVLLAAVGGKFGGAYLGARASGVRPRHSVVLATLMNTRGLTELIALAVGLQLGLLDGALYSLMVVMALVTTAMAGVLLRWAYPPWRAELDRGPERADLGGAVGDRPRAS